MDGRRRAASDRHMAPLLLRREAGGSISAASDGSRQRATARTGLGAVCRDTKAAVLRFRLAGPNTRRPTVPAATTSLPGTRLPERERSPSDAGPAVGDGCPSTRPASCTSGNAGDVQLPHLSSGAGHDCSSHLHPCGRTGAPGGNGRRSRPAHARPACRRSGRGRHRGPPVGLLADRDIVASAVAQSPVKLDALLVGDVMSRGVVTVHNSESVDDAVRQMGGAWRAPVVCGSAAGRPPRTCVDPRAHIGAGVTRRRCSH